MKCKICEGEMCKIFEHQIMGKYSISYFRCLNCKAIMTEQPFWLDEAYSDDKAIANIDTGIMTRNISFSKIVNIVLQEFYSGKKEFIDYGGGYGIFVRLMRDLGWDFVWYDKYCENLLARGFEYKEGRRKDLLTAFEVVEHLDCPMTEITEWFNISEDVLISTQLTAGFEQEGERWWYFNYESGQHIIFYDEATLQYIAKYFGKQHIKINNALHLFSSMDINPRKMKAALKRTKVEKLYSMNASKSKAVEDMNYLKTFKFDMGE